MPDIEKNIISLQQQLPSHVKMVAVSKLKPVSDILEACKAGQTVFGENRVQELMSKKDMLPDNIEWHFIGHLQRNKVKFIVPFIAMIHSVDSFRLLKIINAEAAKIKRVVNCLLQFYIAREETKFGFTLDEAVEMIEADDFRQLEYVKIGGVMGMATFTDNKELIRKEFRYLADCFKILKEKYFLHDTFFKEISMGMTGDWHVAVEEGSTMIRVGTLIFGERIKR